MDKDTLVKSLFGKDPEVRLTLTRLDRSARSSTCEVILAAPPCMERHLSWTQCFMTSDDEKLH